MSAQRPPRPPHTRWVNGKHMYVEELARLAFEAYPHLSFEACREIARQDIEYADRRWEAEPTTLEGYGMTYIDADSREAAEIIARVKARGSATPSTGPTDH